MTTMFKNVWYLKCKIFPIFLSILQLCIFLYSFLFLSCFPTENLTNPPPPTCTTTPEELCGHAHFKRPLPSAVAVTPPPPSVLLSLHCATLLPLSAILSWVTLGHCSWRYASNVRLKDVDVDVDCESYVPRCLCFCCSCHSMARLKKNPSDL